MTRIAVASSLAALVIAQAAFGEGGAAGDDRSARDELWGVLDNDYYKIHVDMRLRVELAEAENLERSEGVTLRTRLGLGTKPFRGFSGYAELENVVAFCDSCYFDKVGPPTGQTAIADPETTTLNRAFLKYENEGDALFVAIAGRQRVIYDDARFIGNVGWRQTEQTIDAAYADTSLGIEGFKARYGYFWEVHRIFGDEGTVPDLKDYDSDSHTMNVSYERDSWPSFVAFAYLLDLKNKAISSAMSSANSYGFRATGFWPPARAGGQEQNWKLDYTLSYAIQTDAAANPLDYRAHYVWASIQLGNDSVGWLKLGFEMLGSDGGTAGFVTPLATAHKFNGFADVFLDNGGPDGLKDLFVAVAPELPWGLEGHLSYHHFWNDETGRSLGNEIDCVISKQLPHGFNVVTKGAYFDSTAQGRAEGRESIWRWWFDITYAF